MLEWERREERETYVQAREDEDDFASFFSHLAQTIMF